MAPADCGMSVLHNVCDVELRDAAARLSIPCIWIAHEKVSTINAPCRYRLFMWAIGMCNTQGRARPSWLQRQIWNRDGEGM